MTQMEDSDYPKNDVNLEEAAQLKNFVKVLVELKIFDSQESFIPVPSTEVIETNKSSLTNGESIQRQKSPISLEAETEALEPKVTSKTIKKINLERTSQVVENKAIETKIIDSQIPVDYLETAIDIKSNFVEFERQLQARSISKFGVSSQHELEPASPQAKHLLLEVNQNDFEESKVAFQNLQELLVGPEIADLNNQAKNIQENVNNLENIIYDRDELVNLLLPSISEVLRRKISISKDEVVTAITPIIDDLIRNRVKEDKNSMGEALSAAIPSALENIKAEELANALAPTIGEAIKKQIEIEQDKIVDALYPVIGNTISKYMIETIQSINEKIEETLTLKGIKRKIKAKLQGVSEAELIVKESLSFNIKAIFLIHKASGLLISEIQPSQEERLESDMVAGMLTAIRDFANDCITTTGKVSELGEIDYGTSKIILEVAGYCYLAMIVNGEPSKDLIREMRNTLSQIIQDYDKSIERFDGDLGTIPSGLHTRLEMLGNHKTLYKKSKKNKFSPLLILSLTILSLIAIPWGIWQYKSTIIRSIEQKTKLALVSTPELSVYNLNVRENQGKLELGGKLPNQLLRKKAAQIVTVAAPNWSINNQIITVDVPSDPVLAKAEVERVSKILNQMSGTVISANFINDKVIVKGNVREIADNKKIVEAFERIPGVKFVSSAVRVKPLKIGVRIYFSSDSAALPKNIERRLEEVKLFLKQNPTKNLKIIGYSNSLKNQNVQEIALQRALAIQQVLVKQGIDPSRLQAIGRIDLPPGVESNGASWMRRCVIFEPVTENHNPKK